MSKSKSRKKKKTPKRVLVLPDLEHAKTAVLNSLTSAGRQRTYDRGGWLRHHIDPRRLMLHSTDTSNSERC